MTISNFRKIFSTVNTIGWVVWGFFTFTGNFDHNLISASRDTQYEICRIYFASGFLMCMTHDNIYSINFSLEHTVLLKTLIHLFEIRHLDNEEEYFDFSSLRFAWIICDRGRDRHFRSWITLSVEPIYLFVSTQCVHTLCIQCAFFSFC